MKQKTALIIIALLTTMIFVSAEDAGVIGANETNTTGGDEINSPIIDDPGMMDGKADVKIIDAKPEPIIEIDQDPTIKDKEEKIKDSITLDSYLKIKSYSEIFYYIDTQVIGTYANFSITNSTGSFNVTDLESMHIVKTLKEIEKPLKKIQIEFNGKIFIDSDYELSCKQDGNKLICDSILDGNGNGVCESGESCCILQGSSKQCTGHRAPAINDKLAGLGI